MKLHTPLLVLAATAALAGCYVPSAPDEVLYGNVVATNYKETADFASYSDVALESTLAIVDDTDAGVSIAPAVQTGIIDQIKKDLEARGYTVTLRNPGDPLPPTGTLRVGAFGLFGSVALFYSSYWCSWYYYYYCYPDVTYAGSYNYGTLLIEAGMDLYSPGQPPTPGSPSTLVWTSATYGVMAGGSSITVASPGYQKVLGSIDQAFAQSPYFTRLP